MTEPVIIAAWPKNARETLMVRLDSFKGNPVLDLRVWYAGGDGSMKPGRGGLTIALRHLPRIAEAMAKALATATASGLLEEDGP